MVLTNIGIMAEDIYIDEIDDTLDDIDSPESTDGLYEHFKVVVDKGQSPVRIDKYLFERIVNASRNRIQSAADAGFVMANGKPVKSSYKVKPLDVITVMMDRPKYDNDIIPEDIPLDIVYEDSEPHGYKQTCRTGSTPWMRKLSRHISECHSLAFKGCTYIRSQ